jgi:RNA polymerase sigma-70 factor (ECF subfamily)
MTETESILHRVAEGDQDAIKECMDRFGGLVWSLARRLAGNAAEAEDAVQEIFIDVWRSAGRFDPTIASETTFIAMIARRRLIDRGRRRARRPEVAAIPETIESDRPAFDPAEVEEAAKAALAAMERLRPEQRKVLELSIQFGRSHEQIAGTTGLPLGTVKTHARRGLIRLREILAEEGIDPPPADQ